MNYSTIIGKNNNNWNIDGYMEMGVELSLSICYMHISYKLVFKLV